MAIAVIGTRGIPANYGGFETCAEQLTRRWVADGQEVLVFARSNRYAERPRQVHGVRLCYVRALGRFGLETPSAALVSALILITRFSRYRWVHVYNTGSAIVVPLLRLFGFRVLVSVDGIEWNRDKWGALQKWAHRVGAWLSARFANRVIADNRVVQDVYRAQFGCEAALIAYGAEPIERSADAEAILAGFGLRRDEYFIFVGRLVPEKRVKELVDAYESLGTPVPLVIIGDASGSEYRDNLWARQSSTVRFVGYQYGRTYEQLLANSMMYVSASSLEGTSPSLLSAMSAGRCCLVNGIPENVQTAGDSVAMFRQDDWRDLASRWRALAHDAVARQTVAESGKRHQRRYYDWDAIASQYLQEFQASAQAGVDETKRGS